VARFWTENGEIKLVLGLKWSEGPFGFIVCCVFVWKELKEREDYGGRE